MPSEEHTARTTHRRKMTDGVGPKAGIATCLTAITSGSFLAMYLHDTGMDVGWALPLGIFIGISVSMMAGLVGWYGYLRYTRRSEQ